MTFDTREAWLAEAVERLRPEFKELDAQPADQVQAIVSWPKGRSAAIGQHFPGEHWTDDGTHYVTVSPELGDDPARVLDVLLHELVHACGISGHGNDFKKVATAVGLTGKMTATEAGPELKARLEELAEELGPYPHVVMRGRGGGKAKEKGKSTRVKATCAEHEYSVEMSRKKAEEGMPAPLCPFCEKQMEVQSD